MESMPSFPLVYLDTAATAQPCPASLEAMQAAEADGRGNVHRGMHVLSERSTELYEQARKRTARFLNARSEREIVFTKNATESLNLVARGVEPLLHAGDCIVLSLLEHHSNIVPWQQLAERTGSHILWWRPNHEGTLSMVDLELLLAGNPVKVVGITGLSNVLGVCTPLADIVQSSHAAGALVCVDAAQLAAHAPVDVRALDCDFLAFSGHKLYGPTGIGVLYGKADLLSAMPPFLGGGSMIYAVTQTGFTPADIPQKFEAGTPPFTQAVGLAAAMDWLAETPWSEKIAREQTLLHMAAEGLRAVSGVTLLGPARDGDRYGCLSFMVEGVHPHDLTEVLGRRNICLRAGHHCAQPLHDFLGIPASTRLSVGVYTTEEDIQLCVRAIEELLPSLRR